MYIVLGIGITAKETTKKLKELKKKVLVVTNPNEVEDALTFSNNVITFDMLKYLNLDKVEYVVKSPGIPYYNKYVRFLRKKHLKVISEIELTYLLTKKVGTYIGVSGSVGKSSVVSLLYSLIKAKRSNVILAGNIGIPLITYLDKINKDTIIILEISSFQLDDFDNMKLNVALLLNIYDNHLDFYKRKQIYYNSKFRLSMNQTKNDYFLVNLDNEIINKYLLKQCYKSRLIDYKSGFMIKENNLYYNKNKVVNLSQYSLIGNHNLDNLKAIIAIMNILNIEIDNKTLKEFKTLDYHLEKIDCNMTTIINDSKSTCTSSLKSAIDTYRGNSIILLFGGYNKNLDFSFLNGYDFKFLICFGALSKEIERMTKVDIKFDTLKEATIYALKVAKKDDVLLFSPGCASFDEFDSYLKRGEAFNTYIREYYNDK